MLTAAGHRQRVRDRYLKEGLDNFAELHVLELLLFYAVPQKDTKPMARALLDKFGSLPLVLEATPTELMTVPGVGSGIATYLSLFTAVGRYYRTCGDKPMILDSPAKYGEYLANHFYGRRNETVFMLCLDAKGKLLRCKKLGEGDVNSTNIPVRSVVETALGANATMVVIAHNHPSGVAVPSHEDVAATEHLARALGAMDIVLLDHVIVAEDDYVSLALSHAYDPREFSRMY